MWVTLSMKSKNSKVGPIPVSMTEKDSCPKECVLKDKDCYARFSFLGIVWNRLSQKKFGDNWSAFCKRVAKFPVNQLWRLNQAGDLPQRKDGRINLSKIRQLAKACLHTKGWTYTHYNVNDSHNIKAIRELHASGMVVNLSADSLTIADEYVKLNLPVVVTLPSNAPHRGNVTPLGVPIVVCPAQTQDEMTCSQCKLCAVGNRKSIVGFLAHSASSKRMSSRLTAENLLQAKPEQASI